MHVGDCGNDLSGNGVELVSIMGCLLHRFVVVLSASGILGHSLLLPPPLCHPLTLCVCVCVCVCVCGVCVCVCAGFCGLRGQNLFNNMGMTEVLQFEGVL